MSDSKTSESLPGDADQPFLQAQAEGDTAVSADDTTDPADPGATAQPRPRRTKAQRKAEASAQFDDKDPVDPSDDKDPVDPGEPEPEVEPERGTLSPAQYEDDGWGDTPIQMRG